MCCFSLVVVLFECCLSLVAVNLSLQFISVPFLQINLIVYGFIVPSSATSPIISLSIKDTLPSPFEQIDSQFTVGDIVPGKVVRLAQFGAFVEIAPGLQGLVHISQISHEHIGNPDEVLEKGQIVPIVFDYVFTSIFNKPSNIVIIENFLLIFAGFSIDCLESAGIVICFFEIAFLLFKRLFL